MSFGVPDDIAAVVDRAESMVFEVADRKATDTLKPLRELLSDGLDRLEHLYDRNESITGVPTGYSDLDERLSGLQPSNLIIVGARPSAGKTSFALGIASHAAMEARKPVLFFSLEMSHQEITQRLLCSEARVDAGRLRNGRLHESDWPKISHAIGRLGEAPIYVDDNPNLTVMDVRGRARRMKSRIGELGVIIIDYLQLMSGRNSAENRQVEVSEISRGLKILARELETPVVALSQLSRNLEMRSDKRPILADLRESGCLTADTRVLRADTNAEVTLGELLDEGARDIPVWSLDSQWRLVPATMTHVFPSGIKPIFRLKLASGRTVDGTANHPFRTLDGWVALADLRPGSELAAVAKPATFGLSGRRSHSTRGATAMAQLVDRDAPCLLRDRVVRIDPLGETPVFDATVLGTHNFIANGIVAHNSLEQDADVVMFIYRDEVYNPESADRGTAEIIVQKHRNGPTGTTRLAFLENYTRFANMARI